MDNPQNVISFCTGYGGLELGIRRAGVDVRIICNVEIETFVQANLVAKIEEGRMDNAPIWTDLKTFPAREFRGKVHGITCGYPCQPFSSAGKRKGEEDPRHLWPYIRRHIRAIDPSWVFAENVQGHVSLGLSTVISDLEEDGYETTWGLFSAEETGAPHQRIRCFILAYRDCEGSQGMLQDFGSQGREAEGRSTARCGEHSGEELGNPASLRPHRGRENCEGEQSEVLGERLESDGELADSERGRCGKDGIEGSVEGVQGAESHDSMSITKSDTSGGSASTPWPARPGEEQYEWEEPRVTEAQSELGGAIARPRSGVDAITNRVDRLRLLGNGVVPQTAELAWRTLWKQLNDKHHD